MERRIKLLVSLALVLQLPWGAITEGSAQDAATAAAKRDKPLEASTCVSIWSKKPSALGSQPGQVVRYGLTYQDYDRLVTAIPVIKRILPIREVPKQIRHQTIAMDGYVVGTTHEFAAFARLGIDRGRFLTEDDNAKYENYAVLGAGAAQVLFFEQDPVGQTVKCGADYYTVVGVAKPSAGKNGERDQRAVVASDMDVYIPLNTCRLRFGERVVNERGGVSEAEECQLTAMVVQVEDGFKPEDAAEQIRSTLKPFHRKDLVGVTAGGLKRERAPVESKVPQAKPKA
jgi:putative ABC transport system permease protein